MAQMYCSNCQSFEEVEEYTYYREDEHGIARPITNYVCKRCGRRV